MTTLADLAPPPPPLPPAFDRYRWTEAVLSSDLHLNSRAVALVLAHLADAAGHLPAGGHQQETSSLAARTSLRPAKIRRALSRLTQHGYIERPSFDTWRPLHVTRPITLCLPLAAATPTPAQPEQ